MSHSAAGEPAGTAGSQGDGAGQPQGDGQRQDPAAQPDGATSGAADGSDDGGQEDLAAQLAHWKAQARKHEARAKDNAKAAAEWQKQQDANKTELQRAQEAQQAAERERDEARGMHARIMAAATHDVPVDLIDLLGTGTAEEIGERAEMLSSTIRAEAMAIARQTVEAMGYTWPGNGQSGTAPTAAGAARASGRPVESLAGGTSPQHGTQPVTSDEWFRDMVSQSRGY